MARRKQKPEPVNADGAPEWMLTFSDCMTLLLTFFVLLLSFSSFDEKVFWNLKIIYARGFSTISPIMQSNKDAFKAEENVIQARLDLDKGNEKPTLKNVEQDALMNEKAHVELGGGKVILIPSKNIFWGNGEIISPSGREALCLLASLLGKVSNRVVICEHGSSEERPDYGLSRSWAVSEHLVKMHGLDRKQLSISAASTLPPKGRSGDGADSSSSQYEPPGDERNVEIVLLDRSIHD